MSKRTFIAVLGILWATSTFAQNLKLDELLLFQKKSLGYIEDYLSRKGWELHRTSIDKTDYFGDLYANYNAITWSYNKNRWNDKAEAWFYLYQYDNLDNAVTYQMGKERFAQLKTELQNSSAFKLIKTEAVDEGLETRYRGNNLEIILKQYHQSSYSDVPIHYLITIFNYKEIEKQIKLAQERRQREYEEQLEGTNANITYGSFYVYSDNNGDKIVNKGETVRLNVSLQNTGSSTANGVKATFSTTSSYVSGFSPTSQISYGNISAGATVWKGYSQYSDYAIQFTVSNSTPANTNIPISINITDESGNSWTASFNVTVSATGANITYGNFYVYSDNNNDKIINQGETVRLNVSLQNTGSSTANAVKATFSTTSSYVSGFTPTSQISYGNISAGSTVWKGYSQYSDYAIQFTVSSSTPTNTQIPISISIVDESNNIWSSSFNVTVQ